MKPTLGHLAGARVMIYNLPVDNYKRTERT